MREALPTTPRLHLVPRDADGAWNDHALVADCLARHQGAAGRLFDRFAPMVRRLGRRLLGPAHDTDDLVQEVFLRLFDNLTRVRDPQALSAFVMGVAVNLARKELRARWVRRWLTLTRDGAVPESALLPPDFEARQTLAAFYANLERLSPAARTLFVLRFVEKMEIVDIARVLGVSTGTVKRRLARVNKHARHLFGQDTLLAAYIDRGSSAQERE